jgi:hypothetical protein
MALTQTVIPPTPPSPPPGNPISNPVGWSQYNLALAQYQAQVAAVQEQQRNVGIIVPTTFIVQGGNSQIPPGTGVEGTFGSRFNEVHTPVPGMENYSDLRGPDQIGTWIDANTGLLRFDRLPDDATLAGRFQNSNGGQYNAYFPPVVQGLPVDDVRITPSEPIPEPTPQPAPEPIPVLPITPPAVFTSPPPPPAPPPPPPPAVRTINLRNLVTLSSYTIDRQYIKGTLRDIPKEVIRVTNTSAEVDITVTLLGLAGVTFSPSTFDLPKATSVNVDVLFDPTVIDSYPEGVSAVNCVVNLTSNTAIVDPLPPPPPTPPTAPPQPPPVLPTQPPIITPTNPVTPTPTTPVQFDGWVERRYGPNQYTQVGVSRPGQLNGNILPIGRVQPELTQNVPEIAYGGGELPAPYYITWVRTLNLQAGRRYKFDVRTDDGMRVFADGRLVLDAWRDQSPTSYTFYIDAAGPTNVYVEYYNDRGIGTATLQWELATSQVINVIPDLPPPPPIVEPPVLILPPPPPPPPIPLPPPTPPITSVWVNGTGEGGLSAGLPPAGWVQDPFGGAWYPPNDPFVLRDFDRTTRPTTIVSTIDGSRGTFDPNANTTTTIISNNSTLIAPGDFTQVSPTLPVLLVPPPPPPPPPPVFIVEPPVFVTQEETFFGGFTNTSNFTGGGGFTLEEQFLI